MKEQRRKAEAELPEVITELAEPVERISEGKCRLTLLKAQDHPEAVVYLLCLLEGEAQYDILALQVPIIGYPIRVAQSLTHVGMDVYTGSFSSIEALRGYIGKLASESSSRLVLRLAFIMWQAESVAST